MPVPLRGKKPSVEALIRKQTRSVDTERIAQEMLAQKLITRTSKGRFRPVSRVATIRQLTPETIEHVSRSLERLLATVKYNTRGHTRRKSLIERTAFVQDLPRSELESFREFAQEQGSAFLANADEWLESRRSSKHSRRQTALVRAGIHVYAFEEAGSKRSSRQVLQRG
jgi:hypothetical protein